MNKKHIPIGYAEVDGELIINPHEAKVIKLIYELYEEGLDEREIKKLLVNAQIPKRIPIDTIDSSGIIPSDIFEKAREVIARRIEEV